MCDRGLHNRGVLQQYMDEHNIQVHHVPLESPESLGRVERHGGLLKALFQTSVYRSWGLYQRTG